MRVAGRLALVGSGEYLPIMHEVEAWLLDGRPRRYVQLATAAAPEGDDSLRYWHRLGADAARRLGAEQVVIDVRVREDAFDPRWVEAVAGAGLIYLSGGNPTFLAQTLAGTPLWSAIAAEWRAGASLAGCSAGAMAMAGHVPDFRHPRRGGVDGLGVVPDIRVLPHFDRMAGWLPDFALSLALATREGAVIGIDEDTALVGTPGADDEWWFAPMGRQRAWLVGQRHRQHIESGVRLRVAHRA